jgi:predicted nucleic acid-binding protein
MPVVLDTTVVSNFAASDAFGKLLRTVDRPTVVPSVQLELEGGLDHGHHFLQRAVDALRSRDEVTVLGPDDVPDHSRWTERIDPGEAASLAVARDRDGTLATDDAAARQLAKEEDAAVTGSVGLLLRCIDEAELDVETADRWLDVWVDSRNYYAPVETVRELLPDEE